MPNIKVRPSGNPLKFFKEAHPEKIDLRYQSWLESAERSYITARLLIFYRVLFGEAVFFCQQTLEKYLKAIFLCHELPDGEPGQLADIEIERLMQRIEVKLQGLPEAARKRLIENERKRLIDERNKKLIDRLKSQFSHKLQKIAKALLDEGIAVDFLNDKRVKKALKIYDDHRIEQCLRYPAQTTPMEYSQVPAIQLVDYFVKQARGIVFRPSWEKRDLIEMLVNPQDEAILDSIIGDIVKGSTTKGSDWLRERFLLENVEFTPAVGE